MPLIEARLLEGVFSADEREQLAEGLINAVVGVKGESFRSETEVLIAEYRSAIGTSAESASFPRASGSSRPPHHCPRSRRAAGVVLWTKSGTA
jgi:phenylpyruvate tautomerase PptA (4-oxalocrotonate tautomerase family)